MRWYSLQPPALAKLTELGALRKATLYLPQVMVPLQVAVDPPLAQSEDDLLEFVVLP